MEAYVGHNVVIDVESMYVYVGRLTEVSEKTLTLKSADVHDLRDSTTTREIYIREARLHGIQANRECVLIQRQKVVSMSLLADVIP